MKKIYLVVLLFTAVITSKLTAQPYITATLVGTFIEGVSPVNNSFTFDDGNDYSQGITFRAIDGSRNSINSHTDPSTVTPYSWSGVDMGQLNSGSKILVIDSAGNDIDSLDLTILAKPDWLKVSGSTAVASNPTSTTFDVACTLDLYKYKETIDDAVKLIGGKEFGYTNDFTFNVTWDYSNPATVTGTNPSFNYSFIALSTNIYSDALNASTPNTTLTVSLDPSFEMLFDASYSVSKVLLDRRTPKYTVPTPIPGLTVSLDAGLKVDGQASMKVVYGKDPGSQQYGFIKNGNNDSSSFAIGGVVTGDITGTLSLVHEFIANVRGSLEAKGKVGMEYKYITQPGNTLQGTTLLGGELQLSGTITSDNIARKFWRRITNQPQNPKVLWEGNIWPETNPFVFGNGYPSTLPGMIQINSNNYSRSYMNDWFFDIPVYGAQPDISTRGDNLCVVWIEADTNLQYLRFAKFNPSTNCFQNEKGVIANDNSISNPKVSLLNNGDAIITWTQNSFGDSNLPPDPITFDDFTDGQDIWFAVYDSLTDNIVNVGQLSDNSGRSEGEATVSAGSGNEALITWVSRDKTAGDADIYYTHITKTGSTWNVSTPAPLTTTGANYSVKVAYADAVNATAVWISDTDNDDLTSNNEIRVADWNGGPQFINTRVLLSSQPNMTFNEIDLDFNENYGALAYTYEEYDTIDASYSNGVGVELYDNNTDLWLSNPFQYPDASSTFKLPRISVDESGFASLIFQKQNLVSDTAHDPGELMIFANDISVDNIWTQVNTTGALNDTNNIVWFLNSGFTSNRDIFVLSQETDKTVGLPYTPTNGVLFGDESLGLVLRKVQIGNSYNLVDGQEPTCVPTGIAKVERSEILTQCYPNPASNYTIIEFKVEKDQKYTLRIFDITGRMVAEILNQKLQQGTYKSVVDLSTFESGTYLYSLSAADLSITKRFVIAK